MADTDNIIDFGDSNADFESAAASKEPDHKPELYEKDAEGESKFGQSTTTTSGPSLRARMPAMPAAFSAINGSSGSRYIMIGLVALIVLFIIVLGLSVGVGQLNKPKHYPNLCTDRDCLWEASYVQGNMNLSVDPCQDFFHYACGNFPNVNPLKDYGGDVDVLSMVDSQNDDKIQDILEAPIADYHDISAEKKLKVFFQSCLNDFLRTNLGGGPLLTMIQALGGWASLPSTKFDPTQWDNAKLNTFLKTAHADYGVDPFFLMSILIDDNWYYTPTRETYMIQFKPSSTAFYSLRDYTTNTSSSRYHQAGYKDFMRTYLQLLWRDSGMTPTDPEGAVNQLYSDVMLVETKIASLRSGPIIIDPIHSHVALKDLSKNYPGRIDWFQLVSYYFRGGGITQNTPVHLSNIQYMTQMTNFMESLNMTTINNYVMWKVAYQYVHELGWEYIHANRLWAWIKYDGYVRYVGHYRWCIIEIQRTLQYLLGSLFVQNHFVDVSYPQVQMLYNYMKKSMENRISGYSWMDTATKAEALAKIEGALAKIGHPGWMSDNTYLNNYYQVMKIATNKHMQNMQNIYQFNRIENTRLIALHTVDRTRWLWPVYDVTAYYNIWWNEVVAPAGMLQHPIFDWRIPQYMNFAAAGRYIGENLISAIDTSGNYWNHLEKYGNWWSKSTQDNFKKVQNCHAMLYANSTYCYDSKHTCDLNKYRDLAQMAQPNWRDVGAVSMAYDAFHMFDNAYGSSGSLLGLQSDSLDQVFFLGFAQTYCYARSNYSTYWYWYWYRNPPEPIFVNKVLGQIPAFASAYNCKSNSPMVSSTCPGF